MAGKRVYIRDKEGQFAKTGTSAVKGGKAPKSAAFLAAQKKARAYYAATQGSPRKTPVSSAKEVQAYGLTLSAVGTSAVKGKKVSKKKSSGGTYQYGLRIGR